MKGTGNKEILKGGSGNPSKTSFVTTQGKPRKRPREFQTLQLLCTGTNAAGVFCFTQQMRQATVRMINLTLTQAGDAAL